MLKNKRSRRFKLLFFTLGISFISYIVVLYRVYLNGLLKHSVRHSEIFLARHIFNRTNSSMPDVGKSNTGPNDFHGNKTRNSTIVQSPKSVKRPLTAIVQSPKSAKRPLTTIVQSPKSVKRPLTTIVQSPKSVKRPLTIYNNPYIIQNKDICKGNERLLYLVVVHTSTVNFERRKSLRETWANINIRQTYTKRLVFLLGKPHNESTQMLIRKESECYGDIVQGNFLDTYQNLTHKAVLGLRWITENCRKVKFIVKVDDDVFVNIFKLVDEIFIRNTNKTRTIFCEVRHKEAIHRTGKWTVEKNEFPKMRYWPTPYCPGFFVIMTADIIPELYEKAKIVPFLWLDDVYVFGLLASKATGITRIMLKDISFKQKVSLKCFQPRDKHCHLLAADAPSSVAMHTFWNKTLDQEKNQTISVAAMTSKSTCVL